jgi:hypothetical protein
MVRIENLDVEQQVRQLTTLSRMELMRLWKGLYKRDAPAGIRRELLIPFIAYQLQAQVYGGLKCSIHTNLLRIASQFQRSKAKPFPRSAIKLGTCLIRTWRGVVHEVVVTEAGLEYKGQSYASLSEIARRITGSRWSGPAFFGTKSK